MGGEDDGELRYGGEAISQEVGVVEFVHYLAQPVSVCLILSPINLCNLCTMH